MVEFVIVGGGVYGAATAWFLARQGAEVHLIEKRGIATGASGGPGRRGVRANGRDHPELPLMRIGYDLWPTLHRELGAAPFYERTGQLLLIENQADRARAEVQVRLQERHGIPSRLLEKAELREREPALGSAITAAIYCPNDGVADHAATTAAFARAAADLGATIEEGVAATTLEIDQGRVSAVITSDERRIDVGRGVFLLANSGLADLAKPWVALPVWNETWQVLVSAPLPRLPFRHLLGHVSRKVALKAEGQDRVMISGGWPGQWHSEREEGTPLPESIAGNVAAAVAVLPDLEGMTIETADAGHQESVSLDGIPVIDRLPGVANAYYGAGWSGHGWAIAPAVAQMLADWALTGQRPALLLPFALDRFAPMVEPAVGQMDQ